MVWVFEFVRSLESFCITFWRYLEDGAVKLIEGKGREPKARCLEGGMPRCYELDEGRCAED